MVIIDYLTKYLEVGIARSTSGKDNIPLYDKAFKTHGYPEELVSDNGPPFNGGSSHSFRRYLKWAGVRHTPTYSADNARANGLAESAMKGLKKTWDTARVIGRDPVAALQDHVHHHNNRVHSSTGLTPSQYLMNRTIRTRLPGLTRQTHMKEKSQARETAEKVQMKQKESYDGRRNVKENDIKVGDQVLLGQKK